LKPSTIRRLNPAVLGWTVFSIVRDDG